MPHPSSHEGRLGGATGMPACVGPCASSPLEALCQPEASEQAPPTQVPARLWSRSDQEFWPCPKDGRQTGLRHGPQLGRGTRPCVPRFGQGDAMYWWWAAHRSGARGPLSNPALFVDESGTKIGRIRLLGHAPPHAADGYTGSWRLACSLIRTISADDRNRPAEPKPRS